MIDDTTKLYIREEADKDKIEYDARYSLKYLEHVAKWLFRGLMGFLGIFATALTSILISKIWH